MSKDRSRLLGVLFLGAVFYLSFVILFSQRVADNDLWGYLSFGRVFWEDGYFPFRDVFSYVPTKPLWVYHEWLTGVVFYLIYKYSGPAGLQLLRYVVILFTIYLIYMTALKKGGRSFAAVIALIPAMVLISFGHVPVRAQIFTYLFFIMTVYILEDAKKSQKWSVLWWLLPIQILWCNLHGGFVAGLGLVGLYALGEGLSGRRAFPYIKIGVFATLATLINPYGIKYWLYIIDAIAMPRPEIEEWMSIAGAVRNHYQYLSVFTFLALAFISSLLYAFRREKKLTDILVLAVTIYLGCRHIRHNVLFGIVFGAYVPVMLCEYWETWKAKGLFFARSFWLPGLLPVALLFPLYLLINPSLSSIKVPSFDILTPAPHFPVGAVNWIKANHIRGNILPHFDWGEYLIWISYPACRVAMDGRYETVYSDQVTKEYFDFLTGRENWDVFLRRHPHDMVLLKYKSRTHLLMLREPSWRVAYADQWSVLFLRNREKGAESK
ncbi:MAG: hypothetical protein WC405_09480 [Syntrophales bacterium]